MWYEKGLKFKCTGCGGCCTGSPGFVWLNETDIERLAAHLNITKEAFIRRYTRQIGSRLSLIERGKNYDCIFYKDKRCTLYEARPKQCRNFPWWPMNLQSEKSWEEARQFCEGIDHPDAPLVSAEEIEKVRNS